jgi:hypothetical protein
MHHMVAGSIPVRDSMAQWIAFQEKNEKQKFYGQFYGGLNDLYWRLNIASEMPKEYSELEIPRYPVNSMKGFKQDS